MSWFETLKGSCGTEKANFVANEREHMRRRKAKEISTKDSIGQDEEAAKRTEDREADLLARLRERNRVAREKANEPVEKLVEWVHG